MSGNELKNVEGGVSLEPFPLEEVTLPLKKKSLLFLSHFHFVKNMLDTHFKYIHRLTDRQTDRQTDSLSVCLHISISIIAVLSLSFKKINMKQEFYAVPCDQKNAKYKTNFLFYLLQ